MKRSILAVLVMAFALVAATPSGAADTSAAWCGATDTAVILGDSTATGYGATGYPAGQPGYAPTANGWPSRMAVQFADDYGTDVENMARNGALVSDFLPNGVGVDPRPAGAFVPDAVDEVADLAPNLIIVALGANEYGSGRSPATYAANLDELLTRLTAAAPDATIVVSHTWEFAYQWPGSPAPWGAFGNVARSTATTHGATYLDMTDYMPAAQSDTAGLYVPNEYGPGPAYRVHTNDAGHIVQFATYYGTVNCG